MARPAPDNMGLQRAPVNGINSLGLGPNATGLALGVLFFGVYFGSSYLTRTWVMAKVENPDPPKYFRDIQITDGDSKQ